MGNTQYLAVLGEQSQHLCRLNVVLTQVQSKGLVRHDFDSLWKDLEGTQITAALKSTGEKHSNIIKYYKLLLLSKLPKSVIK